ncbi:phytanoyl-CoA dioxygenase family protein [Paraburkholderia youngii]|uniref:phytanoyl-CoA dioxygenase family protein n=1 Tax=Paraburkholderia youngii TaxID=2782701 RepID=UPI0015912438|nr:phytanoyl-CoA dioxygenase family protein [Paraburkholderia youngii]NUX56126.1 phytanoyl-CoA dioxygenase family protein [Paraburkholderia youngii]
MNTTFVNPLPGVPDVESPFFDELFAQKEASENVLRVARQLRENGFAIIDFPDAEFDARAERIKSKFHGRFDFDHWRDELWYKNDGMRVQDAWESDADVRSLASNPQILHLLFQLYGRRAIPFQTLNFPVGTQQAIHNDAIHFSCVPERFMCGVWVALEDVDGTNGALEYYPGSHKFPTYVNEHMGVCSATQHKPTAHYAQYLNLWKQLISKAGIAPVTFHARKGQALIWASNLLHGGSKQSDPTRTRWSQVTHYYFENCVYYTPVVSDPAFGQTYYRQIKDASTGFVQPNIYSGVEVEHAVIERSMPDAFEPYARPKLPADFDPAVYLQLNPDVAAANADPAAHFLEYGCREGRRWR